MAGEIRTFVSEVTAAVAKIGGRQAITLEPAEPNVKLTLMLDELGHLAVEYVFRGSPTFEPSLEGRLEADQTYLKLVADAFRELLAEAHAAN